MRALIESLGIKELTGSSIIFQFSPPSIVLPKNSFLEVFKSKILHKNIFGPRHLIKPLYLEVAACAT